MSRPKYKELYNSAMAKAFNLEFECSVLNAENKNYKRALGVYGEIVFERFRLMDTKPGKYVLPFHEYAAFGCAAESNSLGMFRPLLSNHWGAGQSRLLFWAGVPVYSEE